MYTVYDNSSSDTADPTGSATFYGLTIDTYINTEIQKQTN